MLKRSKNNTLRVVALSTVVAFAGVKGTPLCAQTSAAPAKSGNSALLQNLKGENITKENMYQYVTTGNPGDLSLTMSDNEASKVFVLYNKGTGKFLNVGGYWGSSAVLSDVPCPLWLQIRNNEKHMVQLSSTIYEHYPLNKGEVITETRTNNQTNWINKYNDFKAYVNGNESKLYIGSEEGSTRTRAIYNKVQIRKSDGTLKSTLRFESTNNNVNAGTGSTSATETFTGDGKSRFISSTSLSNLNLTDGDVLEAHLDLTPCTSNLENVFSIGTKIGEWSGTDVYNLHIYYTPSTKILSLRGCFKSTQEADYTNEEFVINNPADVVFKLTKDGFYINDVMMPRYYSYTIPYTAGKEGHIAKFKFEGGHYVTDENGDLILDDNGKPYSFDVKYTNNYIYADAPNDREPSLFFSRRLNLKSATSTNKEGNYIGWVPATANKAAVAYDKISDVYTDRDISGADYQFKPEQERWRLIATGANGEYKLALDMTANLKNGSIDTQNGGAQPGRFYLTASTSIIKGPSNYYFENGTYKEPTEADKQYCYYSTLNTDGTRTYTEKYSNDLFNVIMTDTEPTDDKGLWRIVSVKEYIQLLKKQQSLLRDAVDLTALLADPNFTRKDLDLKDWKLTETLQSNDNSYHKALVRIGYDGNYKTKPEDDTYKHGASYNFYGSTDRGYNDDDVANHSRYMCASIQNGGYGQMYQSVQITRNGWYIVRCQGLSTVDARLFARVEGKEGKQYFSPLRKILDEYYRNHLQIMNAKDAYWPYDQCMPMYNAAVEMNDRHVQPNKVEENTTQVLFYIDEASETEPVTVILGIDVPQTNSQKLTNGSATYSSDFTAFDNFRLLYGGEEASEPYLVLDEDDETLDHLDNTIHHYRTDTETGVNKKLLLHRTFTQGKWNSFMLPVGLTEAQFKGAFGDDAQLAELTTLTENEIHFKTVTAESTYGDGNLDATKYWLKPMTAYIIKIADASKTKGNVTNIYDAYLYHWADNGKTFTKKTIGGADNSYYSIEGISMIEGIAPVTEDDNFTHWNFKSLTISDGANGQYQYVATSKAANHSDGTMTPYGMFTRNYGVNADGTKHLLKGRAPMSDAYILSGGKLKYTAGGGASKGFRCWFQFTKKAQAGAAPMLYIDGIGDPTGIEGIRANDGNGTLTGRYAHGVFTINGQRVADASALSSLPHGVYIVNGKKVVK